MNPPTNGQYMPLNISETMRPNARARPAWPEA